MKIRTLFKDRSHWTKYTLARNKYGHVCKVESPNAVRFCLMGAIEKCYGKKKQSSIMTKICNEIDYTITTFNDIEGYQAVKTLVEKLNI